jgi:hypothetical protein
MFIFILKSNADGKETAVGNDRRVREISLGASKIRGGY